MEHGGTLRIAARNEVIEDARAAELPVAPGDYVAIEVVDTGTGMDAATAAQAFEPFFTTKAVGKGSGLGLSQVYGFARQSGGAATIDSGVGAGTTVTLWLPRDRQVPDGEHAGAERAYLTDTRRVILIVEDKDDLRTTVRMAVERLGFRTYLAVNGREALDILRSDAPVDLLFTDVVLPGGISGIDIAREAIQLRPAIKVLITSGYPQDAIDGYTEGQFPWLAKPYPMSALVERIESLLRPVVT